jgi:TonB family protein
MSILFDDARLTTPRHGRSTTGLWVSVVLHAVVTVVVIVDPIRAYETPPAPRKPSKMVFIMPATALVSLPPVRLVAPRLPALPPPKRELIRAEAPKPLPVEPIVARRVEPPPAPIVRVPAPALVEKPVIQRPPETGLFERTTGVRTSQAAAAVTTGGFGTATTSQRGTVDGAVTTGGFGSAATSPRGAADGAVTTGGFGSGARAPRATAQGEVQTSGFDQRASAPAQPSVAAPTKPIDQPVEIVSKPTPEYSDEARSARIEGTVSLELEFTATGEVRVLRVVRGLGHGLDEAAQRAAVRIRFKPAQSDGRPVDSRATVHITFRLS